MGNKSIADRSAPSIREDSINKVTQTRLGALDFNSFKNNKLTDKNQNIPTEHIDSSGDVKRMDSIIHKNPNNDLLNKKDPITDPNKDNLIGLTHPFNQHNKSSHQSSNSSELDSASINVLELSNSHGFEKTLIPNIDNRSDERENGLGKTSNESESNSNENNSSRNAITLTNDSINGSNQTFTTPKPNSSHNNIEPISTSDLIQKLSANKSPRIASILKSVKCDIDNNKIVFTTSSQLHMVALEEIRISLTQDLIVLTQNKITEFLLIKGEVEQTARRPYTDKEKLDYLSEKHPKFVEAIEKLQLRLP